jgi:hypothetical protein
VVGPGTGAIDGEMVDTLGTQITDKVGEMDTPNIVGIVIVIIMGGTHQTTLQVGAIRTATSSLGATRRLGDGADHTQRQKIQRRQPLAEGAGALLALPGEGAGGKLPALLGEGVGGKLPALLGEGVGGKLPALLGEGVGGKLPLRHRNPCAHRPLGKVAVIAANKCLQP